VHVTAWIEGIDAAWGRPTPAQLVAAGKHFIVGYVSHDPAKNLTRAECAAYLDAGIAVGLVWETTSDRALAGALPGADDGREARRQATALGFPLDRPIFVAVDFDATAAQLAAQVGPYLLAFGTTVGGASLAGVYGGLKTVRYALDHKLVGWGWQTYAWSRGVWDARAYARQYRNGVRIAGHDTDLDRAVSLAALWTKESTDMAGFDAGDAHYLLTYRGLPADHPTESLGTAILDIQRDAAASAALGAKLDQLARALADLPAAVAAAVVAALPPAGGVTASGDVEVTGTLHVGAPGAA
jgi:hypothetical protein